MPVQERKRKNEQIWEIPMTKAKNKAITGLNIIYYFDKLIAEILQFYIDHTAIWSMVHLDNEAGTHSPCHLLFQNLQVSYRIYLYARFSCNVDNQTSALKKERH